MQYDLIFNNFDILDNKNNYLFELKYKQSYDNLIQEYADNIINFQYFTQPNLDYTTSLKNENINLLFVEKYFEKKEQVESYNNFTFNYYIYEGYYSPLVFYNFYDYTNIDLINTNYSLKNNFEDLQGNPTDTTTINAYRLKNYIPFSNNVYKKSVEIFNENNIKHIKNIYNIFLYNDKISYVEKILPLDAGNEFILGDFSDITGVRYVNFDKNYTIILPLLKDFYSSGIYKIPLVLQRFRVEEDSTVYNISFNKFDIYYYTDINLYEKVSKTASGESVYFYRKPYKDLNIYMSSLEDEINYDKQSSIVNLINLGNENIYPKFKQQFYNVKNKIKKIYIEFIYPSNIISTNLYQNEADVNASKIFINGDWNIPLDITASILDSTNLGFIDYKIFYNLNDVKYNNKYDINDQYEIIINGEKISANYNIVFFGKDIKKNKNYNFKLNGLSDSIVLTKYNILKNNFLINYSFKFGIFIDCLDYLYSTKNIQQESHFYENKFINNAIVDNINNNVLHSPYFTINNKINYTSLSNSLTLNSNLIDNTSIDTTTFSNIIYDSITFSDKTNLLSNFSIYHINDSTTTFDMYYIIDSTNIYDFTAEYITLNGIIDRTDYIDSTIEYLYEYYDNEIYFDSTNINKNIVNRIDNISKNYDKRVYREILDYTTSIYKEKYTDKILDIKFYEDRTAFENSISTQNVDEIKTYQNLKLSFENVKFLLKYNGKELNFEELNISIKQNQLRKRLYLEIYIDSEIIYYIEKIKLIVKDVNHNEHEIIFTEKDYTVSEFKYGSILFIFKKLLSYDIIQINDVVFYLK